MAVNIRKFLEGLGIIPKASTTVSVMGELEVISGTGKIQYHNGTTVSPLVTESHTATLTNKSMDGSLNTFTNLPAGTAITGQVTVANGGTGASSLTSNGVVIGNGTSPVTVTAEGATGTVLHGNTGGDPTFSAVSLTADVSGLLPIANGGTGQSTQTAAFDALSPMTTGGDLIYGGASGTGTRLANGTAGQILQSNGTTLAPTWVAQPVNSPLTTKGDVYGFSTVNARIPVGADRLALVADSAQTLGVRWGYPSGLRTINAQTGTTYTFVLADGSDTGGNPIVTATNAAAQTYTVPPNSSVAFPVGTQIDVTQLGAGLVTIAQGAGVTINSLSGSLAMSGQYSAVTLIKTATDVWELYGNGASSSSGLRTINTQTGTTYTFVLTDGSDTGGDPLVTASNAAAQTYTVPPNSSVAFPIGTQIDLIQLGAGLVTLAQGSGVTINSLSGSLAMSGQYSAVTLIKTGTDVWELFGNGAAGASNPNTIVTSSFSLANWPITAGQYGDLASISLPAGTHMITLYAYVYNNGVTTTTTVQVGVTTNSGNSSTGLDQANANIYDKTPWTNANNDVYILTLSGIIVAPVSTTTYYFKGYAATSITNLRAGGRITAVQIYP